MLTRPHLRTLIADALRRSRVVALVGPRQVGKTTLARTFLSPDSPAYFDLEDPISLQRLSEPVTALGSLTGIVVIDEVHRMPNLFPILRVLADRNPLPAKFLVLGSASPELLRQSSESLVGRIETLEIGGFNLSETGAGEMGALWQQGGFPLSFLAETDNDSMVWRKQFIQTFLERDFPSFGLNVPAPTMLRFWRMLAHYHGQVWNASEMANSMSLDAKTVRRYLDYLTQLFMVRQLQPWHENLGKRQVKSPKIYFRDSGVFHALLGVGCQADLLVHPKMGASWEGFAVEQALRSAGPDEAYFWATHAGAELDLLMFKDGKRIGVECKHQDAPKMTASMRTALHDLKLDALTVYYPGTKRYPLAENVWVEPLASLG